MNIIEIKAPEIHPPFGEVGSDMKVVRLLPKQGDFVEKDQLLFEVESELVVLEIRSPQDGRVVNLMVDEGTLVKSKVTLANIDIDASKNFSEYIAHDFQGDSFTSGMLGGCLIVILWIGLKRFVNM